ncbi:MAG: hypothetical protein O3A63_14975 [Proteobacteria bacterium]|nr:hypothetical protein [Pseudomonadota bacterium]
MAKATRASQSHKIPNARKRRAGSRVAARAAVAPDFEMTNAWHLRLDEKGNVEWVSDDRTLSVQPATSFMQRIEDWFFSHLPSEGEL